MQFTQNAPFIRKKSAVWKTMLCVILALLPTAAAGCVNFGIQAVMVLLVSMGAALGAEFLSCLIFRRLSAVKDLSAVVTGLVFGLLLPPDLPLWQAAAGSAGAVIVFKQFFGGIGRNLLNPAAAAKLVMLLVFAETMSQYRLPMDDVMTREIPILTGGGTYWDLFLGNTAGTIGEVCAGGALLGGIFLCLIGVISPAAPFAYLLSLGVCTFLAGNDPVWHLLAGGTVFGAFFLATDYTTAPLTGFGKFLFGLGCGVLTFCVRRFTEFPETVCSAVIVMNLFTPLINKCTRTKPFGAEKVKKPESL